MEIPTTYQPQAIEQKWYDYWLKNGYFHSVPDGREPYTVVIPPPNVTGVLHMGHMLNNTIQDVLVRRARMQGKNACWVPGTDHASIATEAKVVRKLREQGILKRDLTREQFLEHAWEWTHEHGGIILEQLKKLGASCDWERTRFTMDEKYYESVIDTFIDLHKKGYIYRGVRMVHWDPVALTALSDEEVIHKEERGKLFHLRYEVEGVPEGVVIATTRPETILGDTAICVHPEDARYNHLHGRMATVPLCGRQIPIICDSYVDMEFGTGCLKITPAHDPNDHELGARHGLEVLNIFHPDGTLNEHGGAYAGMDRFAVRKQIALDLEAQGALVRVEEHTHKVGRSERTDAVIEPRLSLQWFVAMSDLARPALEHVMDDTIRFYPPKFKNSYRNWMEQIKDWCISRQLWWGQRIPAWYYGEGMEDFVVAKTAEAALALAREKSGRADMTEAELRQDEDVLDTWFSSWLWPISVFDGFYSEEEIGYYYPTADLVTAPEIMFFWVARMSVAGYEYRGAPPFRNVYYTGIVRDKQGRKMSKSLGNSPDPLELMAQYGADGVRVGMLLTSPAGNDLPFDEKLCEQGRNFSNKIWNAYRLTAGWQVDATVPQPEAARWAVAWMKSRFHAAVEESEVLFAEFRLSEALMATYKLVWDDFCSVYLELAKPAYGAPIDAATHAATVELFGGILKLLHPFMPFMSEEIWHWLEPRGGAGEALCIAAWPAAGTVDGPLLQQFDAALQIVAEVRTVRKEQQLPPKEMLELEVMAGADYPEALGPVIRHLAYLSDIRVVGEKTSNGFGFVSGMSSFHIPVHAEIDVAAERAKIEKEMAYHEGFVRAVRGKLGNAQFVANAPPQVVALEQKKEQDALAKLEVLKAKLNELPS